MMNVVKKMLVGLAAAVLVLPLAGAMNPASALGLLSNADFETGTLTSWGVFGGNANAFVTVQSPDNGPSAPGQHNAFMDNHAEAIGLTLKGSTGPGTAAAGTVHYSFDLKLGQAAASGVFFVQVFAEQAGGGVIGGSVLLGNYTPATWTTYTGTFVAPAGTDFLTIQFMANTGAVTGAISSMHVDNVNLYQDSVPTESSTWGSIKSLYN
jgi:hypothetical protein